MQTGRQSRPAQPGADPHADERDLPALRRFVIYLDERFPPLAHGLLIAAFAGAAVCYSALERGNAQVSWAGFVVAFIVLLLFFFQLRIADEHKDLADDTRYRPERPVPRGLITLKALRRMALAAAALQLASAVALHVPLTGVLLACWVWMALMGLEFGAPRWLRAHPVLYLLSHMVVMPLFALFAVAAERLPPAASLASAGVVAFAALSFANGVALEVARKCAAPNAEREGVETYSALWGPRAAGAVAAVAIALAVALALVAAALADIAGLYAGAIALAGLVAATVASRYATRPHGRAARLIEPAAGLFVLACYLLLGPVPVAVSTWSS